MLITIDVAGEYVPYLLGDDHDLSRYEQDLVELLLGRMALREWHLTGEWPTYRRCQVTGIFTMCTQLRLDT